MRPHREYDRYPLWRDPVPLIGIDQPRVASATMAGFSETPGGKHKGWCILATERVLHDQCYHGPLLDTVGAVLHADTAAWKYQRPFYSGLLYRFFSETGDDPAWVGITPQRITMHHRQERGIAVETIPFDACLTTKGNELGKHPLYLGGMTVPSDDLLMAPRQGAQTKDTRVSYQTIQRNLINWQGDTLFRVHEHWCFLASGDAEDQADMAAAQVPSMRQFFDAESRIQAAAIISLCKLSRCGEQMSSISFDLHPYEDKVTGTGVPGQLLDFRSMIYPFEFYLRSYSPIHALLRQSVTPGGWDYL